MKMIRFAHGAAGVLVLAASACVQAQTVDAASSPAPASASAAGMASSAQPSKSADRALVRRVLNALEKAKGLRASGITVRAKNGAVLLEGWVPEAAQIDVATRVAQGVSGVKSVQNTLTLSTF